ncbi:FolB domain-containing protein [Halosquirtibacter laminarini]|uniref:FolB domain-containing protein n=1 Tax=Halosquirtibacter laminarini TaxID=3374600 RepID=A0AC61NEL8_9BACT|nr:FolB domain-containing protein [Prolixibacteraceae bacterium]
MQIRIQKLHLRTYIGFNKEEQEKKQDIYVHIKIQVPFHEKLESDDVSSIYNYKSITKQVILFVEENRFLLLEKLTNNIADIVLSDSRVESVEVEVEKPFALRFADSVSVTIVKEK